MKFILVFFSLLLIPATISAQDAVERDQQQMHRLHSDPKSYLGALEDPKRDAYQKPKEVMGALGLKAGEVIADIAPARGISLSAWRFTSATQEKSTRWM